MPPTSEKPKTLPRRLRWRTLFKLAILAIFITTLIPVLQLAIPALMYRDDLLALLNYSDDCHAPCFMGITPGVTTYDEAIEILENHNWVETVILETTGRNEYYAIIKWEWTDNAPEILRVTDLSSSVYSAYRDNIIYHLFVYPDVSLSTILLNFGLPEKGWGYPAWFTSIYTHLNVTLNLSVYCNSNLYDILTKSNPYLGFEIETDLLGMVGGGATWDYHNPEYTSATFLQEFWDASQSRCMYE
jgi:hypothetical protein